MTKGTELAAARPPGGDPHVIRKDVSVSFGVFAAFEETDPVRVAVAKGQTRTGLSYFLRTVDRQLPGDFKSFYVSGSDKTLNSFFNQVFTQLLADEEHKKRFTAFIARQKGSGQVTNILRTLAVCIPIIGPAFGVAEHTGEKHLSALNNDIHILNLGAEYLAEISAERPIIIALDLAPGEIGKALAFLARFASNVFRRIKIIVAISESTGEAEIDRIIVGLESAGYEYKEIAFPAPTATFVADLYAAHGLDIKPSQAEAVASRDAGDIYRILRSVYALKKSQSVGDVMFARLGHDPSPIEKKIIGFLAVAEQALPESELIELLLTSKDLFVEDTQTLRPAINVLADLGILTVFDLGHDRSIALVNYDTNSLVATETSRVDYLLISRQLFSYFDDRFRPENGVSSLKHAALLYRLAAICDPDRRSEFGRSILRYSVLMQNFGELESKLSNVLVNDDAANFENFVLGILYRVATKDYAGALAKLSTTSHGHWRDRHPCLVLEAICNNRVRSHKRADQLLELVTSSAASLEEHVVLQGYRIANFLHWGRAEDARAYFNDRSEKCRGAENFGYLTRNAAAAFDRTTKLKMEIEAAAFFEQQKHHYGQYSSMVNAAATEMALDHYDRAAKLIDFAQPELEKYGVQNSVIVTFNAMALAAFSGDLQKATQLLERFRRQPDHNISMTEMYTLFYESLLAFRHKNTKDAACGVRRLQGLVDDTHMARAKERLYTNNLALAMGLGFPDEEVKSMAKTARTWPDQRDPVTTERVIGYSDTWLGSGRTCTEDEVLELLCPPYFAYWYMDEISLLSRAWFAAD